MILLSSKKPFNRGNLSKGERKHVKGPGCRDIKSINPRKLSFFILNQYFSEKSNLKLLLNKSLKKYDLSELDKRFVFEVVKGTVRYFIRIDFLISLFSNKKVESIDKDVLNILSHEVLDFPSQFQAQFDPAGGSEIASQPQPKDF